MEAAFSFDKKCMRKKTQNPTRTCSWCRAWWRSRMTLAWSPWPSPCWRQYSSAQSPATHTPTDISLEHNTAEPSTNLWVDVLVSFGLQHYSTGNKSPKIIDAGYGTGICAFVIDLYAFCKHCCSLFYLVLSRLEHWAKASLRCFAALFLRFLCLPIRYRKKQKTWVRYSFK